MELTDNIVDTVETSGADTVEDTIESSGEDTEYDPLECFVEKKQPTQYVNPFYVSIRESANKVIFENMIKDKSQNLRQLNITRYPIRRVCVMCLRKGSDTVVPEEIYDKNISQDKLKDVCKIFCLMKCSFKILNTINHLQNSVIVSKDILANTECNFELFDFELVVPMFDIKYDAILNYIQMYGTVEYDYEKLNEVIQLKKYFNSSCKINSHFIIDTLNDFYWMNTCSSFNLLKVVNTRSLKKHNRDDINDVQTDYNFNASPNEIGANKRKFVKDVNIYNIYTAMLKSPRRTYYVNSPIGDDIKLSKDQVTQMFYNLNDRKSIYDMFNAFAVSKRHCHLVVNNTKVLQLMKPLFDRYTITYATILTYPAMSFYIEECMFGTKVQKDFRYVFTIDTAHELPVFSYAPQNVHMSPYNVIALPNKELKSNYYGLKFIKGYEYYGIDTLDGFRNKFNLFTTKNINKNIFDGIDWKYMAVTGSTIPACVPTRSPLIDRLFNKDDKPTYEQQFLSFFDRYYGTADIDVVCCIDTVQGFIDETYKVYVQVKKNLGLNVDDEKVQVTGVRHARTFISKEKLNELKDDMVSKYPELENVNLVKELNKDKNITKYFYDMYVQLKMTKHKNEEVNNIVQKIYNTPCVIESFNIRIISYDISKDNCSSDCTYIETKDNKIALKMEETIRFKVMNNPTVPENEKILHRQFEVFRSRDAFEPFSTIARFHLPCVRGYYNGENVYMTPTCVFAHLTYMNLDYNYFAGTATPIDILKKYMGRGYGIYLNKSELIAMRNNHNLTPTLLEQKKLSDAEFFGEYKSDIVHIYLDYHLNEVTGVNTFIQSTGEICAIDMDFIKNEWKRINNFK